MRFFLLAAFLALVASVYAEKNHLLVRRMNRDITQAINGFCGYTEDLVSFPPNTSSPIRANTWNHRLSPASKQPTAANPETAKSPSESGETATLSSGFRVTSKSLSLPSPSPALLRFWGHLLTLLFFL